MDAVLVETERETIRAIHRFSNGGIARGSIAASIVGLLRPAALVCGALAGGVGEQTITALSGAIDRGGIKDLGEVMDRGRFTIIVVSATPMAPPLDTAAMDSFARATAAHIVTTGLPAASVMRAAIADDQRAP
jgi:hypothetical protein